jgi:hypothetical protein
MMHGESNIKNHTSCSILPGGEKKGSNPPAVTCSEQTQKFKNHKTNVYLALQWTNRMSQWTTIYMNIL